MKGIYMVRITALGAVLGLLSSGCHEYRAPTTDAPHAVVTGTFAGGELDRQKCVVQDRGYEAHVTVCEGQRPGHRCKREVFPYIIDRTVSFRVPVGRPLTITPYGLVGLDHKNTGNEVRMTTTKCHGESRVFTPETNARYHFVYTYDPRTEECAATWYRPDDAEDHQASEEEPWSPQHP